MGTFCSKTYAAESVNSWALQKCDASEVGAENLSMILTIFRYRLNVSAPEIDDLDLALLQKHLDFSKEK